MKILISPAKSLDFKSEIETFSCSQPKFLKQAEVINNVLKEKSPSDLKNLQNISEKLADLNWTRNNEFNLEHNNNNSRPALFAFNGDVYAGLDAGSMSEADIAFAQAHLRILSGLYGVLKPLDLMQPYRLEMGTKLATESGNNLYEYWGHTITDHLNETLATHDTQVVVNLASTEYFSAVKPKGLNAQIITPVFKDEKNGKVKIISFYAKKARGMMARYIIDKRIDTVDKLSEFDVAGYRFAPEQSSNTELVFVRLEKDRP